MVADLLIVLGIILCSGVGWAVRSSLRADIRTLIREQAALRGSMASVRKDLELQRNHVAAMTDQVFDHVCKPATVAHSPALVKRAPKAAPVKAAATKAPAPRSTRRSGTTPKARP